MATTSTRHFDLLELFMPTFSGHKDEFDKEIPLSKSLAFDRVNEGQPFSSSFLLSRLPIELVWLIIELVPKEDLPNLALVNRDCRQLARSRQFSNVVFDYSDSATSILGVLVKEHLERSLHNGKTQLPSIGACIRRITVATRPEWVTLRHGVSDNRTFRELEEGLRNQLLDRACSFYFDFYMQNIILILSNPTVLPRLESLDWMDRTTFNQTAFEALPTSNIQRLSLRRVQVEDVFSLARTIDECNWNLKALSLDVMWKIISRKESKNLSPLLASFLYLASPTLETLRWACLSMGNGDAVLMADSVNRAPSFPKLQDLEIAVGTKYDPAWLQPLLQPGKISPIRRLSMDIGRDRTTAEFFENCGNLPRLETFVWSGHEEKYFAKNMAFLKANPQIRKFNRDWVITPTLIDNHLLPLLCRSFSELTSLSLTWKGEVDLPDTAKEYIPQKALDQIATLHNLEQLCLSTGCQVGWRYTWIIDHSALQNMCRTLPKLRNLALNRDTYDLRHESDDENGDENPDMDDPIHYYSRRLPRNWRRLIADPDWFPDEPDRYDQLTPIWETDHRNRMIGFANQYAVILPELEWIFLGELPMGIKRAKDGEGKAVPLSESRDSCYTLLKRMFGVGNAITD